MKYFFVVGELSGDIHAANLIKEIKNLDEDAVFEGWGGDSMKKESVHIHKHVSELAFMGFSQVVLNIRTILNNFKLIKRQIQSSKADVLVLVDYPGFNLRLAKWAKENNYKVIYYIAPQAWAWKANRVEKLIKYTDKVLCILPFEKQFFEGRGLQIEYVGHPLIEQIDIQENEISNIIALLPGSRRQEVMSMLPTMLEIVDDFPDFEFYIAKSPNLKEAIYLPFLKHPKVHLFDQGISSLFQKSQAALVTSGTATLETALYEVPQIVCYKSGLISYKIAKRLVKVPFISLVNLIAEKEVVKELIQNDFTRKKLTQELTTLFNPNKRAEMINEYRNIKELLGGGHASKNAAQVISTYLNKTR